MNKITKSTYQDSLSEILSSSIMAILGINWQGEIIDVYGCINGQLFQRSDPEKVKQLQTDVFISLQCSRQMWLMLYTQLSRRSLPRVSGGRFLRMTSRALRTQFCLTNCARALRTHTHTRFCFFCFFLRAEQGEGSHANLSLTNLLWSRIYRELLFGVWRFVQNGSDILDHHLIENVSTLCFQI